MPSPARSLITRIQRSTSNYRTLALQTEDSYRTKVSTETRSQGLSVIREIVLTSSVAAGEYGRAPKRDVAKSHGPVLPQAVGPMAIDPRLCPLGLGTGRWLNTFLVRCRYESRQLEAMLQDRGFTVANLTFGVLDCLIPGHIKLRRAEEPVDGALLPEARPAWPHEETH